MVFKADLLSFERISLEMSLRVQRREMERKKKQQRNKKKKVALANKY